MNKFLREQGFGLLLLIGAVLVVVAVVWQRSELLGGGIVLVVIGALARPIEKLVFGPLTVEWQKEATRQIQQALEGRLTFSGSLETKKITGTGGITVPAPTVSGTGTVLPPGETATADAGLASGVGKAYDATVETASGNAAAAITRPQTPGEFAETVVKAIEPIIVTPEAAKLKLTSYPPDVRVEAVTDDGEEES